MIWEGHLRMHNVCVLLHCNPQALTEEDQQPSFCNGLLSRNIASQIFIARKYESRCIPCSSEPATELRFSVQTRKAGKCWSYCQDWRGWLLFLDEVTFSPWPQSNSGRLLEKRQQRKTCFTLDAFNAALVHLWLQWNHPSYPIDWLCVESHRELPGRVVLLQGRRCSLETFTRRTFPADAALSPSACGPHHGGSTITQQVATEPLNTEKIHSLSGFPPRPVWEKAKCCEKRKSQPLNLSHCKNRISGSKERTFFSWTKLHLTMVPQMFALSGPEKLKTWMVLGVQDIQWTQALSRLSTITFAQHWAQKKFGSTRRIFCYNEGSKTWSLPNRGFFFSGIQLPVKSVDW